MVEGFRHREQSIVARNASLEKTVSHLRNQLAAALERTGELWIGEIHPPLQSAERAGETDPVAMNPTIQQSRIAGQIALLPDGTLFGEIELHECNPASRICTSGGSLALRDSTGRTLCTTPLSLLSAGQNQYELRWTAVTDRWGEDRKIRLLRSASADASLLTTRDLEVMLSQLYSTSGKDESPEGKKKLIASILAKALKDRLEKSEEWGASPVSL